MVIFPCSSNDLSKVPVQIMFYKDAAQTIPGEIDGPVQYSVVSGDATLDFDEAGTTGFVVSGTPGITIVRGVADVDLGEGVNPLEFEIHYLVSSAQATVVNAVFGEPVSK